METGNEPVPGMPVHVLCWMMGALLIPLAFMAALDLIGGIGGIFLSGDVPRTWNQLHGLLRMVASVAGFVAGVSARERHSARRKRIHFVIATVAAVWVYGYMVYVRQVGPSYL